ncbi:major facilitator superfamily domain-containing protein [Chiua virens]|nr:major facilitator superfamily domain-containing protein [Chiua virens]
MAHSVSPLQTAEDSRRAVSNEKEDPSKAETQLVQFPEGGTAAWCTIIGATLIQFCGFGYTMSFGIYQDYYTLYYLTNKSSSAISWIGSINAFLTTAVGLVSGLLYDRGYFYHLLIGGSLLQSFNLFMLSLTQPGQYYQIFLAQGIGLGISQGFLYVPTLSVLSHYFQKRRTFAMSLVTSGSSLGAIIHPIMLNYLFNRGVGFANGVRISAAFISVLLLIACSLTRTRLEPPQHPTNCLSVGRGVIRDPFFCLACIGLFCLQIGFFFVLFYLQLDSVKHGNSETFSFYSLAVLSGGALIARLTTGFIASRVGVLRLMIITTTACSILTFGMTGLSSIPTVVVLGGIFGYFSGIYIALLAPLMSYLTHDFSELGARIGIGMVFVGVGNLIGASLSQNYVAPSPLNALSLALVPT